MQLLSVTSSDAIGSFSLLVGAGDGVLALFDSVRFYLVPFGSIRLHLVQFRLVPLGSIRFHLVQFGLVWFSLVSFDSVCFRFLPPQEN